MTESLGKTALLEPWGQVLALGKRHIRAGVAVGLVGALTVHGALAERGHALTHVLSVRMFAASVQASVHSALLATLDVELEEPPPPEPEPEEPPEPPPPDPEPPPRPVEPPKSVEKAEPPPEAPPPAAAEAAKVLTAEPDPNEPLDLTGDMGFVTGTGERYVGGVTAAAGTSKKAVYDRTAKPDGVPGQTGKVPKAPVPQGPDLSRSIVIPRGILSNCGLTPEALAEGITNVVVPFTVVVDPSGKAKSVTVLNDPGYGLGSRAKRCALRAPWGAALDRSGKPITSTRSISMRFVAR